MTGTGVDRYRRLLWTLPAGVSLALLGPPGSVSGSTRPGAPPDARLDRRIRGESQVGVTVQHYLKGLSSRSEVGHRAAPDLASLPLAVLNEDLPLRDLQSALGWAAGASWGREGDFEQYVLAVRRGDRNARATALNAARQRGQASLQSRWSHVRRLAHLPDAQLARLQAAGDPHVPKLRHARTNSLVRLVFALPEPVLEQFWRTGRAEVKIASLSPELQGLAQAAKSTARIRVTTGAGEQVDVPPSPPGEGRIYLRFGGTIERPTAFVIYRYSSGGTNGNLLDNTGLHKTPLLQRRRERSGERSPVPEHPDFLKKVTLRDPALRGSAGTEPGERPPEAKPLALLLKDLAKQTRLPVIAECEYRPKDPGWLRRQWWLGEEVVRQPLGRALDLLCSDFECQWKYVGGSIVLRPRLWFQDPAQRRYSVPRIP